MPVTEHASALRPQRVLGEGMIASAARFPDKVAVVVDGKSYFYAELLDASLRLAGVLRNHGIKKGDRVAIYLENSWPCIVSIYGALFSAAAFLLVNPQAKSEKLKFIMNDSGAKILITDVHLTKELLPIVDSIIDLKTIISSGGTNHHGSKQVQFLDFETSLLNAKRLPFPVDVIPNDLAALIYTSGSTGFPKGVMQTHQSMVFAAWSLIEYQRLSANDRILLVLPLAFDYGLYQLLMAIKLGGTLIVERSFTFPRQVFNRIDEQQVTVFPAVPTLFAMMISAHKKKNLCFPSITRITNTAAALPADFIPYLKQIFPSALIYKMYGLTECKRVSYLEPELIDKKPTSVGKAIPGTEIYLLSPEGDPVNHGEPGILYVRGPHIMLGYWKQPEKSAKMLKPGKLPGERVLCTQDFFRMDDEGFLYFVGRSDDIIKTKGEKVSPVEVENAIYNLGGIAEVCVMGVSDPVFGEAIAAFVVLNSDSKINEKVIKRHCITHLENFMVPKTIVFLDSMPKTSNGKIDKKLLAHRTGNREE